MDVLIRELDEMCRESQELRDQLAKEMGRSVWPERRHTVRITPHVHERRMPSTPDGESGSS